MKYITSRELSEKWCNSQRRIVRLALDGKIKGARLYGRSWMFPEDSEEPADGRTRACKAEMKPFFIVMPPSQYDKPAAHGLLLWELYFSVEQGYFL